MENQFRNKNDGKDLFSFPYHPWKTYATLQKLKSKKNVSHFKCHKLFLLRQKQHYKISISPSPKNVKEFFCGAIILFYFISLGKSMTIALTLSCFFGKQTEKYHTIYIMLICLIKLNFYCSFFHISVIIFAL